MTTRHIYRESPSSEYLISDGTIAAQTMLYTVLGAGAAVAPVLRLADGHAAPGWIALCLGCVVGLAALTWRIRVQDGLRVSIYEESIEEAERGDVLGDVYTQVTPHTTARGIVPVEPRVLRLYAKIMNDKRIAGGGQRHSRDDMGRAYRTAGMTFAHDDWDAILQGMIRAKWSDGHGTALAAFWQAHGLGETHEVM